MMNVPAHPSAPDDAAPTLRGRRRHLPGLAQCLAGGLVLVTLGTVAFPAWSQTEGRGKRIKLLAQAKQVGLALKIFASDNDGTYPTDGTPPELIAPTTSNAAFAPLFPQYVMSETIFGNPDSAYQTRVPDNVIDSPYTGHPLKTLVTGENTLSYLMGLTDSSNPGTPLIMEGTDGTGHYVTDTAKPGGAGGGRDAIVIYLDNHAAAETLTGPADARFVPLTKAMAEAVGGKEGGNLLQAKLYGKDARLLDPAH